MKSRKLSPLEEIESEIAEIPCPKDTDTALRLAASIMGKLGGSRKSPAKTRSSRENGKRGGRPRKNQG